MHNTNEKTYLIDKNRINGLSTTFAVVCILDVFGVFPVVTLPKAIMDCGYYGFLVIIIVCSMQMYTAVLLGRCWMMAEEICPSINNKNRYPYAALTEITFGKRCSSLVTFLLDLTVFGGGIPNLIVASQNLQLFGQRVSNGSIDVSYCYWIIVVGTVLCPILWFGSPKDMKGLCSISVCIVLAVFFLTSGCILFSSTTDPQESPPTQDESLPWKNMLKAYGILAFQFDIHPSLLTIQVDMNDKSKLPTALLSGFLTLVVITYINAISKKITMKWENNNRVQSLMPCKVEFSVRKCILIRTPDDKVEPKCFGLFLISAVCLLTLGISKCLALVMFGITTLVAYLKLGLLEQPSVLEILPTTVPLHFTALLVAVQLCLTSAVSNSALYQQIEDCMHISRHFNSKRCVLRTTISILAIVIAESVPKFDLVMSIIGGTLTGPLVFVLPPLMFLKMKSMKKLYAEQLALDSFTNIVYTKNVETSKESRNGGTACDMEVFPSSTIKPYLKMYIETSLCIFIIFFSICLIFATTYLNFSSAVNSYTNVTMPCIYNVSKALIYI